MSGRAFSTEQVRYDDLLVGEVISYQGHYRRVADVRGNACHDGLVDVTLELADRGSRDQVVSFIKLDLATVQVRA